MSCSICETNSNIETHHIIPKRFGGTKIEGNKISLRKTCHRSAENQTMTPVFKAKLRQIGKDEDWYYMRLIELGIINNPFWMRQYTKEPVYDNRNRQRVNWQ